MTNYDLSVLIPARNEQFLALTIKDILKNKRGKTEIIVGLDGKWSNPPIEDHPDVTIFYVNPSIGQRGITNQCARLSKAKYVMKSDAHCAFDEGFDVKMIAEMRDDYTMIPTMYNLHAFDWVCKCGNRIYQGPTPEKCSQCGGKMEKEILWKPRKNRRSYYYRFDKTLHFQYWGAYGSRPEAQGDVVEIMSAQGSCFMLTRKKYWELDICDEKHGSWGQQGVEVAMKTWLSGGKLMVNKKTWYSHMFRTQGLDFGFPYPISGRDVDQARKYSRWLWQEGNWKLAKYDLNWLLKKFYPVPDWHDNLETLAAVGIKGIKVRDRKTQKGIVFYTDNQLNLQIAHRVQKQLKKIGLPITSASLKPMTFGRNVHLRLERGYLTMFKQILAALEASNADIVYFCEHDVLYHPSHFDFTPPKKDIYYYNTNVWRVRSSDGHALKVDDCKQVSGLCAYRDLLIKHYKERIRRTEARIDSYPTPYESFTRGMGFEPGTHNRPERIDDFKAESWNSEYPNIDIRHDKNLTPSRWSKGQFRNQKYTQGWIEGSLKVIPGWNIQTNSFNDFLNQI